MSHYVPASLKGWPTIIVVGVASIDKASERVESYIRRKVEQGCRAGARITRWPSPRCVIFAHRAVDFFAALGFSDVVSDRRLGLAV
jgi:hypothetical protein